MSNTTYQSGMFGMMFYKGTRPGIPGIYNRIVRAWDKGPFSHMEVVFSDGMAASSSFEDRGVRFKEIKFSNDRWEFVQLPTSLESMARQYFVDRAGKVKYDLLGNLHFIVGFISESKNKEFCSESGAASIGLQEPWRYTPNSLHRVVQRLSQWNTAYA